MKQQQKTLLLVILLLWIPLLVSAQLIGIGTQYADAKGKGNAMQFAANIAYPTWHKKNALNTFVTSGIDYTGGSSPVAGLNIKPIQLNCFISEALYNNNPFTLMLGFDTGYIFNFRHGKDGLVLTPNVHFDYKVVYLKAGYDMNVTANRRQFFVRVGVCLSIGTFKMIEGTQIW